MFGQAGVAWGMFMGSYDAVKDGHVGVSRALYVVSLVTHALQMWKWKLIAEV
jgi:hypothetical protein